MNLEPLPFIVVTLNDLPPKKRQHVAQELQRLHNKARESSGMVRLDVTRENAPEVAHVLERLANLVVTGCPPLSDPSEMAIAMQTLHAGKLVPFRDALDAIHRAGGHVWDDIPDPDAYIRELRGDDPTRKGNDADT